MEASTYICIIILARKEKIKKCTLIPPSTFGMVGPLLPEPRNGLASPSISVAAGQLPCRTYDYRQREI